MLLVKAFFKDADVRADKRVDHSVDVLVGNNYGGFNKKAKTTYAVKSRDGLPARRQRHRPPRRSSS